MTLEKCPPLRSEKVNSSGCIFSGGGIVGEWQKSFSTIIHGPLPAAVRQWLCHCSPKDSTGRRNPPPQQVSHPFLSLARCSLIEEGSHGERRARGTKDPRGQEQQRRRDKKFGTGIGVCFSARPLRRHRLSKGSPSIKERRSGCRSIMAHNRRKNALASKSPFMGRTSARLFRF